MITDYEESRVENNYDSIYNLNGQTVGANYKEWKKDDSKIVFSNNKLVQSFGCIVRTC